jgi:hypothetical protein
MLGFYRGKIKKSYSISIIPDDLVADIFELWGLNSRQKNPGVDFTFMADNVTIKAANLTYPIC